MRGRSVFTIIGIIVAVIVALVVIYFAWIGWRSEGKPVPDVDVKTETRSGPPSAVGRPEAAIAT